VVLPKSVDEELEKFLQWDIIRLLLIKEGKRTINLRTKSNQGLFVFWRRDLTFPHRILYPLNRAYRLNL